MIIALLGLLFARLSYSLAARTARAERDAARRVANLSLIVDSARLTGEGNYEPPSHFILGCHFTSQRCLDMPIVMKIDNLGQKTASGVGLYLRYPRLMRQWDKSQAVATSQVTMTRTEDSELVHFEFGEVNPGEVILLDEHISITDQAFCESSTHGTFVVGFKLEQRDASAVEGEISFGLINVSGDRSPEAIDKLSQTLEIREPFAPKRIRDRMLNILYRLSEGLWRTGKRMLIGRFLLYVTYDVGLSVADQRIDRVPATALVATAGVLDRRGALWIPGINARKVLVFHGKIRPEVAAITGKRVPNPGVHTVTQPVGERRRRGQRES